jgi:SAM-dependent methyltransferase
MSDALEVERAHEDAWHARAIAERFFDREGFQRLIRWNLDALCRLVPLTPQTRLLSIGCGAGEYELRLARHVASVVGLDLSCVAVEEARRRARAAGAANATFVAGPVVGARVEPGSVDVVVAFGVFHHLGDEGRRDVLAAARQWLAPGGWVYLRDPNARGLLRRAAGRLARRDAFHSPNEAALDPEVVSREVRDAGFRDLVVDYTDVFGGPLPWMTAVSSPMFWNVVFAADRLWLATPGLRSLASQFAIAARR